MEYLAGDPLERLIQSGKSQPLAHKLKIVHVEEVSNGREY
jgi:hypothetical protein